MRPYSVSSKKRTFCPSRFLSPVLRGLWPHWRFSRITHHEAEAAEGLRLLVRQRRGGQRLVVICPRLEDWLIQRARSSGIKPEDYGLPSDPDRLHGIPHYEQKGRFRQFLVELMDRDHGMSLLRQWVFQSNTPCQS